MNNSDRSFEDCLRQAKAEGADRPKTWAEQTWHNISVYNYGPRFQDTELGRQRLHDRAVQLFKAAQEK
jgi:hypothetical protein